MKRALLTICLAITILLTACSTPSITTGSTGTMGTTGTTASNCVHTDHNDDGNCDSCQGSVLVELDFYTINDLHGKLADGDNHIGVDELTTYIKNAQATENAIVLSAGDMWQGSSESNMTQGLIMTDWMNQVGFAAMALGNHEYDWGEDAILKNDALAQFPFLAINVYDRETNSRVSYCDASTVVDIAGVQVGIIGAMGDCYSSISSDKTTGIYFVTGSALTKLVKEESDRLRQEAGVDFIVYVIHDGYGSGTSSSLSGSHMSGYYDISLSDGYVDLVFEGHTHQKYAVADEYGVYHLQHRGDNSGGISHAEIRINSVTGTWTLTQADLVPTSTYASLDDDPMIQQLLEKYDELISPANRVVGTNRRYRNSDELCDLVAQLYYELGRSEWGDQYLITLGGGFLSCRSPYSLPAGEVLYSDLQSIFPFDNDIVLCSVKGADLLSKFINTSNDRYHIFGSWGQIDPNATYYVVVDSYTASYAPNRLTVVAQYTPGIYARDLLADYITGGGYA